MTKFNSTVNIPLYRITIVYLRLAEAVNRMGYPQIAFAILKDGISSDLLDNTTYMTDEAKSLLQTTLPFLSSANTNTFTSSANGGIHSHGAGYVKGIYSLYQYETVVEEKFNEIDEMMGITTGRTLNDTINAMEDILCDEYALEFAFEGKRFGDLCRLARHKNTAATYSADFGSLWLARKLAFKNPAVDMTDENNWYLPFN